MLNSNVFFAKLFFVQTFIWNIRGLWQWKCSQCLKYKCNFIFTKHNNCAESLKIYFPFLKLSEEWKQKIEEIIVIWNIPCIQIEIYIQMYIQRSIQWKIKWPQYIHRKYFGLYAFVWTYCRIVHTSSSAYWDHVYLR